MTADELRWELDRLSLSQNALARMLRTNPRTVRRWATGTQPIPETIDALLKRLDPAMAQQLAKGQSDAHYDLV